MPEGRDIRRCYRHGFPEGLFPRLSIDARSSTGSFRGHPRIPRISNSSSSQLQSARARRRAPRCRPLRLYRVPSERSHDIASSLSVCPRGTPDRPLTAATHTLERAFVYAEAHNGVAARFGAAFTEYATASVRLPIAAEASEPGRIAYGHGECAGRIRASRQDRSRAPARSSDVAPGVRPHLARSAR